jgi:hypothetical protein
MTAGDHDTPRENGRDEVAHDDRHWPTVEFPELTAVVLEAIEDQGAARLTQATEELAARTGVVSVCGGGGRRAA